MAEPAVKIREDVVDPLKSLPAGFVIDEPQSSASSPQNSGIDPATGLPPLPEGFILDEQQVSEEGEDLNLLERLSRRLSERGEEYDEIWDATNQGEQTEFEGYLQTLGKTGAGTFLDVTGEFIGSGLDVAGDVASFLTPDFIEEPIIKGAEGALEWAITSDLGQLGIEALREGEETYEAFKREYPRAARNIESVFNVGLLLPAGRVLKIGSKTPQFTKKQLESIPDSDTLTRLASGAYKQAKQSGGVLKPESYLDFLADFERKFSSQIEPSLHPKLTGVLKVLEKRLGNALNAEDLHIVRRVMGEALNSSSADERRLGLELRNRFDDFIEKLPGTDEWKKARAIYTQAKKMETVQNAIERASIQATGFENGLRTQFRSLLNNERKMRGFTASEKKAMQAIVDGDFTTNTLKKIGKIGFGSGQQSNIVGGSIGAYTGSSMGGSLGAGTGALVGGIALPAAGNLAARKALARTQRSADILRAFIADIDPKAKWSPYLNAGLPAAAVTAANFEGTETKQDKRLKRQNAQ